MEEARYILSVGVKMPMGIHMVDRTRENGSDSRWKKREVVCQN